MNLYFHFFYFTNFHISFFLGKFFLIMNIVFELISTAQDFENPLTKNMKLVWLCDKIDY